MEQRLVMVPDIGDAFVAVAEDLSQALAALTADHSPGRGSAGPPPREEGEWEGLGSVLLDGFGLEALDRIWPVLQPTQSQHGPLLLGPGGRPVLGRLAVVALDEEDLRAVGDAVAAIGAGLRDGHPRVGDLLAAFVDDDTHPAARSGPLDVVSRFARWHGLLDLEWNADAQLLRARLANAPAGDDVELTAAEAAALRRQYTRFATMWGPHAMFTAAGQTSTEEGTLD